MSIQIKKINKIEQCGIFNSYSWSENNGQDLEFKNLNILYGRNYSGKTTLSRIVSDLCNQSKLPFGNGQYNILLSDGESVTSPTDKISASVFNEDYILKNLAFFYDSDKSIEPFAVMGEKNIEIEKEIKELESELGSETSGLVARHILQGEKVRKLNTDKCKMEATLSNLLSEKAKKIKNDINTYREVNYDKRKLENDIRRIQNEAFKTLNTGKIEELNLILKEEACSTIHPITACDLNVNKLIVDVQEICIQNITNMKKIEELVKNVVLSKWVEKGKELHYENHHICMFCGNEINNKRWDDLENHFDDAFEEFRKKVSRVKQNVLSEVDLVKRHYFFKNIEIYSIYNEEKVALQSSLDEWKATCCEVLEVLSNALDKKYENPFNSVCISINADVINSYQSIFKEYRNLIESINKYTSELEEKQESAREKLRLNEVKDFIDATNYKAQLEEIEELSSLKKDEEVNLTDIEDNIEEKRLKINQLNQSLNDAGVAIDGINNYLKILMDYDDIHLELSQRNRFIIMRNDKIATHLSEGEKRIIALCYFLASLKRINFNTSESIVWIDDPICSLDSNHIFSVFSILSQLFLKEESYGQLFISTHNLEFLGYLKEFPVAKKDSMREYFIVERVYNGSRIKKMPKYLKEKMTMYHYSFDVIYQCFNEASIDDSNVECFYNFGNNARSFLEIHLNYKYPAAKNDGERYKLFFKDEDIGLINRIVNEKSHLKCKFEQGSQVPVLKEIQDAAGIIIEALQQNDNEQYEQLKQSIGV